MSGKRIKSGLVIGSIIGLILLAILNLFTFLVPFPKQDLTVFYTAYGCAEFVLLAEFGIILSQVIGEANGNQRVLALPIVFFGCVNLVLQLIATSVFYSVGAFIVLPVWLVVLVEALILGLGAIQVLKGFFFKARNREYHESTADTRFMDEFRGRLGALCKVNETAEIEKPLRDLLETAAGSDPVTNEKTIDSEEELLSLLQELDLMIKEGSLESASEVIAKTKGVLLERNAICKSGK